MKRHWDDAEISREWSLSHAEFEQLKSRTAKTKLAFAALLKFFLLEGRFPKDKRELPSVALQYLAKQLDVDGGAFDGYDFNSRTAKRDREIIREQLGFRRFTVEDSHTLAAWLSDNVFPVDHKDEHVSESAMAWCRRSKLEPPSPQRLERAIASGLNRFEQIFSRQRTIHFHHPAKPQWTSC